MSGLTVNQGAPVATLTSAVDNPAQLQAALDWATPRLNLAFDSVTERDTQLTPAILAALPDAGRGVTCWLIDQQIKTEHVDAGVWRELRTVRTKWIHKALRTTQDNAAAGAFASVAGGTWTSAPAGQYEIKGLVILSSTASSIGNMRLLANGANLNADSRSDTLTTLQRAPSGEFDYTHAGGNLAIELLQYAAAGTMTLYPGSVVTATYLGPTA